MKTKLVVLLVAALAIAGPAAAGKGKPAPKGFQQELRALGISCPARTVELRGTFAGAGDGFMALVVSKATGKAAALAGKQVSLRLLHSTKILRNGPTVASRLKATDRVNVVALMCSQGLVARTVIATAR